jgi:lipopolysaccharide export system permease protein
LGVGSNSASHVVQAKLETKLPGATMTIFSRYVFRQAGGALLLILLSLSGIIWISLALRELNVVTTQGQGTLTLVRMTTLGLPNFMAIIAPFALLIAVTHTLNRLNTDSELIVLTASGATFWTVARPIVALGLLVMVLVSFVNHLAMPWTLRLLSETVLEMRADLLRQVIQPGRFSSPEQGLTFHIRERSLNGQLEGLIMHDVRDPKESQTYLAEHGAIVKQGGTAYLIMTDGHIVRRTAPNEPAQIVAFKKYAIDLNSFNEKTDEAAELRPRERYLGELLYPEPGSSSYRQSPNRFTAEVHERFANPFYPIAFVLIGFAAVGQAQSTRQHRVERMVAGIAAAVAIRLAGLAVNNLVVLNTAFAPLLYAIPLLAAVVALFLIKRGVHLRRGLTLISRLADALALLAPPFRRLLPARAPRPRGARR